MNNDNPDSVARRASQKMVEQKFSKQEFQAMLQLMLDEGLKAGKSMVDVRAADLHARVGGYPGRGHSMPTCCSTMREAMKSGDTVLADPPKGAGPILQIRYCMPR
jgi:hypothetical protein